MNIDSIGMMIPPPSSRIPTDGGEDNDTLNGIEHDCLHDCLSGMPMTIKTLAASRSSMDDELTISCSSICTETIAINEAQISSPNNNCNNSTIMYDRIDRPHICRHRRRRRRRHKTISKQQPSILIMQLLLIICSGITSEAVNWSQFKQTTHHPIQSVHTMFNFSGEPPPSVIRQSQIKVCEEQSTKGNCENNPNGTKDVYCYWTNNKCITLLNRPTPKPAQQSPPSTPTPFAIPIRQITSSPTSILPINCIDNGYYYNANSGTNGKCIRTENIPPFKTVYPTLEECCQVSFGSDVCPSDDECENVPTVEPTRSNWSWSEKPTARPTTKLPTRLPTKEPTREPTFKPSLSPSLSPSNRPTDRPTLPPTRSPTNSPSQSPTPQPSSTPSIPPSVEPSSSPTEFPTISSKPTPFYWPSSSPTISGMPTSNPSPSPSDSPSTSSPTYNPTIKEITKSPSAPLSPTLTPASPTKTSPPTSAIQPNNIFNVDSSMNLVGMEDERLDDEAKEAWLSVTTIRIKGHAAETIGINGRDLTVIISLDGYLDRKRRRRLQEQQQQQTSSPPSTDQLQLNFTTTIKFNSNNKIWDQEDANGMVAMGFDSPTDQRDYIKELQGADDSAAFSSVSSMKMSVEDEVITQEIDDNENPVVEQKDITTYYIIGGAVCGGLLLMLVGGLMYKRKKRREMGEFNPRGSKSFSSSYPHKQDQSSGTSFGKSSGSQQPPQAAFNQQDQRVQLPTVPPAQNYFGTIESRECEDDVSTLGDPYFGEGCPPPEPRADETVAESMISSEQEMYVFGVGRPRLNTGGGSTKAGGSTIVSGGTATLQGRMVFGDDTTLEDVYKTPDTSTNPADDMDEEQGGGSSYQRLIVVAPGGKLGIVVDNQNGDMPVIHAIKESSVLNGRLLVGDFLLSVDEINCQGMSAVQVSRLIASRSNNPTRTLAVMRNSGSC